MRRMWLGREVVVADTHRRGYLKFFDDLFLSSPALPFYLKNK